MKRVPVLFLFVMFALPSLAQRVRYSVYIEPQNGFETYVAAAIAKKKVPVDVLTDPTKATYRLKAAPVEIKQESTGGKIARCLCLLRWDRGQGKRCRPVDRDRVEQDGLGVLGE